MKINNYQRQQSGSKKILNKKEFLLAIQKQYINFKTIDKFFIGSDLMKESITKIIKLEEYRNTKIKLDLERKELLQLIKRIIETK